MRGWIKMEQAQQVNQKMEGEIGGGEKKMRENKDN